MREPRSRKLPVIIMTGFLGSGKTTVLNHIVKHPDWKSTAVIINEFGEIGIDHMLVETSTEVMIELSNGCICCTIRGDLADKLGSLAMWLDTGRVPPVDRIIVETTGLADPAPIMHTLMTSDTLLDRFRLDSVVTVVDAITGRSSLDRFSEAEKQVAVADKLIISKGDLVEELSDWQSYACLRQRIRRINPRATVHESNRGEIDLEVLKYRAESDADVAFADFTAWLNAAETDCDEAGCSNADHDQSHNSSHHGITSFVVRFESIANIEGFSQFLQELAIEFGEHILRLKGILNVVDRPETPAVIHGVQHVLFPVSWLRGWQDDDRSSKLVFITHGLEQRTIQTRFASYFAQITKQAANVGDAWYGLQ